LDPFALAIPSLVRLGWKWLSLFHGFGGRKNRRRKFRCPWFTFESELIIISRDMNLTDDEKAALIRELDQIINETRYPLSPRIMTLKAIRAKLRPEPVREPVPLVKQYEPPRHGRYRRRR
jgi:hypothetical protein